MILGRKNLTLAERQKLIDYVYDIVGLAIQVRKELPCSLPEYIYQEAFFVAATDSKIQVYKEYVYHPKFRGKEMQAFLRMDFVIPRAEGNIVVEAKAIDSLTNHERSQLFSYLVATRMQYGLLVNFATFPHPEIERYYFDPSDMTMTAF